MEFNSESRSLADLEVQFEPFEFLMCECLAAFFREAAQGAVEPGDLIAFDTQFAELGPTVRGKAFDDRAGCASLIALVQEWFVHNSRTGEVPDESTIRKRLIPLWRKLRGEEPVG